MNLGHLAKRHRLTVDDYHRMGETGILGFDLRTELIQGEIVAMTPIGPSHGGAVKYLLRALSSKVGTGAILSVQDPVVLDPCSEPQPDLALPRPRAGFYRDTHPRPQDVLLLIEVADTTLPYDRDLKLPLYARAGIPEVWLVDLNSRRLLIHRGAGPGGYAERTPVADLSSVPLPLEPARTLDLSGLF